MIKAAILTWAEYRIIERHFPVFVGEYGGEWTGLLAEWSPRMLAALDLSAAETAECLAAVTAALAAALVEQGPDIEHASQRARDEWDALKRRLEGQTSTPLPENWLISNARDYRAAFLRATNDPQIRRSRREIRELLGISDGNVGAIVRHAGLQPAVLGGEFEEKALKTTVNLDVQVRKTARMVRGYPRMLVIEPVGAGGAPITLPYLAAEENGPLIDHHLAAGAKVLVRYQVANRYVIAADEPLPARERPINSVKVASSRTEQSVKKVTRRPFFGPGHDPLWVRDQLLLGLLKSGRLRLLRPGDQRLLDTYTGEILVQPAGQALLALLFYGALPAAG